MNTDPQNQPDLTAYALGELDHANDAAVHAWLVSHPEAQAEVDEVADLAHLLQASAPVPTARLTSEQRHAILSGPQRVREMVAAASKKERERRKRPDLISVVVGGMKFAAAAAVVAGAFVLGEYYAELGTAPSVAQNSKPVTHPPADSVVPADASSKAKTEEKVDVASVEPEKPSPQPVEAHAPSPIIANAPVVAAKDVPAMPIASAPVQVARVVAQDGSLAKATSPVLPKTSLFVFDATAQNTAQTSGTAFTIHPADTRPPAEPAQKGLAAPIRNAAASSTATVGKEKAPVLLIHSWRAEVAACPWNETRRLVRISVQIPGEQDAALSGGDYAIQVSFQPIHVKSFRTLARRSVAPVARDGAAVHTAWYEVVPNGNPSDVARAIGQVTLSNSKFTTTAMSLFDSSKMQIVDKGSSWEAAPDDFIFESAVVGFGLLLDGSAAAQGLNHTMVLDLAERALKVSDRSGERARFVKLVKDAQRAVGVKA